MAFGEHREKASSTLRFHRKRIQAMRAATAFSVLVVYCVGVVLNTGLGSLSTFGVGDIATVCPVGALETMIAGRVVLPLPLIATVAAALSAIFLGRAFCSWICPVPPTRKLVTSKRECDAFATDCKKGVFTSNHKWKGLGRNETSALGVLGITFITTLLFGFPVFCLVCPIGLVFATLFSLIRLVVYNELIIDVIVFPALIVLELVILRKWCATLCPVGAFLGLFARLNHTLVPTVDKKKCLVTAKGSICDACHMACNSDIDLIRNAGTGVLHDCTKCHECADHCPASAITFPLLQNRTSADFKAKHTEDALGEARSAD